MAERRHRWHAPARSPIALLVALLVAGIVVGDGRAAVASQDDGSVVVSGPVRVELEDGGGTIELGPSGRRYLDTIELVARDGGVTAVNELSIEDYVAGVAEMPSRWPMEALKAQAVAARTYAWHSMGSTAFDGYDLCATVACQVFLGADRVLDESTGERWKQAVDDTAGEVLLHDGGPILARYFSTSGGRTYANEEVFPSSGPRPYLQAIEDPDDAASPYHRWTVRFTREEWDEVLAQGDTLGATVPIADVERLGAVDDPGASVQVTGEDGTVVEVGARDLREFLSRVAPQRHPDRFPGLREDRLRRLPATVPSSRFEVEVTDDEVVLHGQGWGHGVGLGQYGARGRAERGETYEEILAAYYAGLEPTTTPDLPDRIRVGFEVADELTVTADHPARIVADGEVVVERTFGRWVVTRADGGFRLTPPPEDTSELEVATTRTAEGVPTGDAVVVETQVNKPVLLRLEVTDPDGGRVLQRELGVAEAGSHAATWRFRDEDGAAVPPGTYRVALVAEDAAGATGGAPVDIEVTAQAAARAERAAADAAREGRDDAVSSAGLPAVAGTTAQVLTALLALTIALVVVGIVQRRRT
jgi:SpoIID/LytB domain protein